MPFQDTSGSVNIFLTIYRFFILLLFAAFLAIAAKLARPKSSVFHTQRCHSVGIGLNRECFSPVPQHRYRTGRRSGCGNLLMCPPQGDYQGAISIAETGLKFCLLESTEVLKRLRQRRTIHLQEKLFINRRLSEASHICRLYPTCAVRALDPRANTSRLSSFSEVFRGPRSSSSVGSEPRWF